MAKAGKHRKKKLNKHLTKVADKAGAILTLGLLGILVIGAVWFTVAFVMDLQKDSPQEPKLETSSLSTEPITKTILFVPGWALTPYDYRSIAKNLEDQGYEVIYHYPTYNDTSNYKRMVDVWTQDVQAMVGDKKVIAIGHSSGGGVVTNYCAIDRHCVAGINLDGTPYYDKKIPVPFLYLQGEIGHYCDKDCLDGRLRMEKIATASGSTMVKIPNIYHANFTDIRTDYYYSIGYLGENDGREEINNAINQFLKKANRK